MKMFGREIGIEYLAKKVANPFLDQRRPFAKDNGMVDSYIST
jgi:hypothetical protein